ncbi:hypothetical protein Vadar_031810 [Vaccinium darrowii]|uniref:Uncharacterized protein n=1 Tax=Vaccinium darrowii TaxID=229202 RepID=A0ACB7Z810_9ERIC|nr:hypothetical protein Vadar_031810 [Vaccinium darrowii]
MAYKPPLSVLLLLLCCVACARLITDGADHVSDGVSPPLLLRLNGFGAADSSCDQTYGFLPCTTTVIGNLFPNSCLRLPHVPRRHLPIQWERALVGDSRAWNDWWTITSHFKRSS